MAFPRLAAHGFLHLPALGVGRVRGDEAFHATGLHRDDAHGDTTQPSAAHDDGLTPALQIPGHEVALDLSISSLWTHMESPLESV